MSNCRITPVLVLVLVFSFMFGGCGRDMDLRELSQDQVPSGAGEEDAAGEGAAGEAEAFPGAGGSGGEDAVSYTHLDVYKRQIWNISKEA